MDLLFKRICESIVISSGSQLYSHNFSTSCFRRLTKIKKVDAFKASDASMPFPIQSDPLVSSSSENCDDLQNGFSSTIRYELTEINLIYIYIYLNCCFINFITLNSFPCDRTILQHERVFFFGYIIFPLIYIIIFRPGSTHLQK